MVEDRSKGSARDALSTGGALDVYQRVDRDGREALTGRILGQYQVDALIGEGGMSQVWSAHRVDGRFDRQVAIKLSVDSSLSARLRERFLQEQSLLAELNHPNIAQLYDAGVTEEGWPYIVMEYVEGEPVDRYCDARTLSLKARLELFLALCDAVQFAHRRLIVHRDIKPGNILVTSDDQPKLLDFGIAKLLEADRETGDPARTAFVDRILTPLYASPEQILGESVSTATDVYALGLLLYELLTGRQARKVHSLRPSELEKAVCESQPVLPSLVVTTEVEDGADRHEQEPAARSRESLAAARGLTPGRLQRALRGDLDNIIMMALRREPDRRYATASQIVDDVRNYLAMRPVRARADSAGYRLERFVRRNTAAVTSAIAVVFLITATIAFYTNRIADQRDIAEAAAEEARIEALRAERVADFLADLFRASEPDGPADQLPTTLDLLELGAQRALDPSSALPEERLGMLMILGHVLLEQNRYEKARPLLDAALELARTASPPQPDTLANALIRRAYLDWRGGSLDDAEQRLQEAEALVAGVDEYINLWARAVMDRAWVASMAGDHKRAAVLLQPLVDLAPTRTDISPGTKYRALERQSSIHQKLGNLEISGRLRAQAEPYLLDVYGPQSRAYAIFLANSSNLEHSLGRLQSALDMNRRALDLYDSIYAGQPAGFRAVARRNRVRMLLAVGRFDEGLNELAASTAELAQVRSLLPEEDARHHFYYGEMMLLMRRWAEAGQYLGRARDMYMASEAPSEAALLSTNAMLVWALCQQGISDPVNVPPAAFDALTVEALSMGGSREARIRSARACMHWREGRLEDALSEIDLALDLVTDPGSLLERAERLIVRGRILESMGDLEAARAQVVAAIGLFAIQGLDDHPNVAAFKQLEQELAGVPISDQAGPGR